MDPMRIQNVEMKELVVLLDRNLEKVANLGMKQLVILLERDFKNVLHRVSSIQTEQGVIEILAEDICASSDSEEAFSTGNIGSLRIKQEDESSENYNYCKSTNGKEDVIKTSNNKENINKKVKIKIEGDLKNGALNVNGDFLDDASDADYDQEDPDFVCDADEKLDCNEQIVVKKKEKNVGKGKNKCHLTDRYDNLTEKEVYSKVKSYQCTLCKYKCKTEEQRKNHRKAHKLRFLKFVTTYKCPECNYKVHHSTSFKSHFTRHSKVLGDKMLCCPQCPFKSKTYSVLDKHILHHGRSKKYSCRFCSFSHDHSQHLTKHLRHHNIHPTGIWNCDRCPYTTKQYSCLFTHKINIHDVEKIKWVYCAECPFKSKGCSGLKKHKKNHEKTNGFKCPQCTFRSDLLCKVKSHMKLHRNEKGEKPMPVFNPESAEFKYSCTICSFKTMLNKHFERHKLKHTKNNWKYCADCPYKCLEKIDLVTHVICHKNPATFKCPWCTFSHNHLGPMTKHKRLHYDERESKNLAKKYRKSIPRCPVCKELFRAPSFVKRHMLKHTSVDDVKNPFLCAHCPYKAKSKDPYFINHVMCHLQTDGLKCPFCTFRHARKCILAHHIKLHSDKVSQ